MRWLLVLFALPACAGYQPGSFASGGQAFPTARTSIDCVDIALDESPQPMSRPVVEFTIANGCESARVIDFAAVRLTAEDGGRMSPFDPRRELRPATLEARTIARIVVAFGNGETATPATRLCFDLDGLIPDASRPPRRLCAAVSPRVAEVTR